MHYSKDPVYRARAKKALLELGRHLTRQHEVAQVLSTGGSAASRWFNGVVPEPTMLEEIERVVSLLKELELLFTNPLVAGAWLADQAPSVISRREDLLERARWDRGEGNLPAPSRRRTLTEKALAGEAFAGLSPRTPELPEPVALSELLRDFCYVAQVRFADLP